MHNEIFQYYSKTPPNRGVLDDYTITYWEENRICGDDLKVYIKIENDTIKDWSFEGDTAIITTGCASIFGETIIGMSLTEVLTYDNRFIEELIGMPVSTRRKQASVLGLLTTKNALHIYLQDGKKEYFEDVIVQ